ncbi:MAG TPA: Mpo1-like protein [Thermoanaerobaculia bacterium]|jgi:uncharacterized membrane protein YGL010W
MRRIDALLADYGSSHESRGNVLCHVVGITLILFGVLDLLHRVRLVGPWTLGEAVVAVAGLFYLSLDLPLGLATTAALVMLDLAARAALRSGWGWGAAAFVVGWIFQGIGHAVYEKKSPAFLRNLVHLLVGPAFLVNELLRIHPVAPATISRRSS